MKYLGVDYGTKRIGLAISDDSGMMAFPRGIVPSGKQALSAILDLVKNERIESVVVGNSLDAGGARNAVMDDIDAFIEQLHALTNVPIELQDERFSSAFAKSFDFTKSDAVANPRKNASRVERVDDRAAAIMLQRYLDSR